MSALDRDDGRRILVWDVPVRVFHWTLAASFLGAFVTAESERWRDVHVLLGYTVAGLLAFRLFWGFAGTRHARFAAFLHGPRSVLRYLGSLLTRRPEHHVGHNPAGSWAIWALIALGLATVASGYAVYELAAGRWLEELHEFSAHAMLAVVAAHVAGVVASSFLHRENLVVAMLTGRKRGAAGDAIGSPHRFVGTLLAAAVLAFWVAGPDRVAAWASAALGLALGTS